MRETLTKYPKELIVALGIYITVTAPFYTSTVFIGNFMQTLSYTSQQSTIVSSIILIVMMIVLPISAYISDKIGRRPVLIWGIILLIVSVYPIFICLGSHRRCCVDTKSSLRATESSVAIQKN